MAYNKNYKVLSYDVFDTCLARICGSQEFAFELLAKSILGDEAEKSSLYDFVLERKRAEEIARKKSKKEDVTLKSIYENADFTILTNIGTSQIINKELEIHKSIITPIYEIKSEIEDLHSQGIRIIYISDMYLPKMFILSVLIQHGFYKEGDLLYVSSEIGLTKATGHLYDYVKEELDINFNQWLHKGDNEYSDIYIPKKKGISTKKISYQYTFYENKIARFDYSCSDLTLSKVASCERVTRLSFADSPYVRFASDFIAPMYVPFVYSILLDAEKRGIRQLFFIARDGYILLKIAEVFQELFPNIQIKYLYASRKSLYLPGINDLSLTSLLEVLPINGTEAIIDFLSYLHLSNLNININEFIGLDKKTVIEKLLNYKDFNIALSKEYNEQSRLCIQYFEEIGLTMPNCALVDAFGTRKTVKFINNILRRNGYNNVFSYYFGVMEMRVIDQSLYKAIFYKERVQNTAYDSIYSQKQNIIE